MATLKDLLPPPRSHVTIFHDDTSDPWFKQIYITPTTKTIKTDHVPLYNTPERFKNHASKPQDFADGGTYENASKIVYSQHKDLVPKILKDDIGEKEKDVEKLMEIERITQETKSALEKIVNVRISAVKPKYVQAQSQETKYIKYKRSQQSSAYNSGAKERIIRMVEMQVDPLEPPRFKHKRFPKLNRSPPVPIMHSPPRPVTMKEQPEWKIPPCISNWKNRKGYTIPLDKRLASDGYKGLQEVKINDNFAKISESLYVSEQKAREAVSMRSKIQMEMMMKKRERREQELLELAQKARSERIITSTSSFVHTDGITDLPSGERMGRENIRGERRRERERESGLGKKSKIARDIERDVSEKVALGMAAVSGAARGGEVMYDQRLFNQEKGMDSGFVGDDKYNVYDCGLFNAQPTLSTLYKPKKDEIEEIRKNDRFKPHKGFSGCGEKGGVRGGPVELERWVAEEADPYNLDPFLMECKGGKSSVRFV